MKTVEQQLAEAQNLVRFWEHQHELDMKLLQNKGQQLADAQQDIVDMQNELNDLRPLQQRIATLEADQRNGYLCQLINGNNDCTCICCLWHASIDQTLAAEQERDRLQAQLEEAKRLLADVIEDDCRNVHITQAAAAFLSRTEKKEET